MESKLELQSSEIVTFENGTQNFRATLSVNGISPKNLKIFAIKGKVTITTRNNKIESENEIILKKDILIPAEINPRRLSSIMQDVNTLVIEAPIEDGKKEKNNSNMHFNSEDVDHTIHKLDSIEEINRGPKYSSNSQDYYVTEPEDRKTRQEIFCKNKEKTPAGHLRYGMLTYVNSCGPKVIQEGQRFYWTLSLDVAGFRDDEIDVMMKYGRLIVNARHAEYIENHTTRYNYSREVTIPLGVDRDSMMFNLDAQVLNIRTQIKSKLDY